MIRYQKFTLDNGLTVLINELQHPDRSWTSSIKWVPSNETADKTGFAHLFEHLMFGGSVNAPDFDTELQLAGGTNNAFTTNDLTNYYDVLPVNNIETALWLESDRMLHLDFSERSLDVQRNVVCEEFKEHYINRPYGDVWHKLREMVYTTIPTAGLPSVWNWTISANRSSVTWSPSSIPGTVPIMPSSAFPEASALQRHWNWQRSGLAISRRGWHRNASFQWNPYRQQPSFQKVETDVPVNLVYQVFHMDGRNGSHYAQNLLSDVWATANHPGYTSR